MNRVGQLMQTVVVTIDENEDVARACALMEECHVGHLPVMAGDVVVGMVSASDLRARPADDTTIRTVMSAPAFTLEPDDTLGFAADLFELHAIKCAPIVDASDSLIGIVTAQDIRAAVVATRVSER